MKLFKRRKKKLELDNNFGTLNSEIQLARLDELERLLNEMVDKIGEEVAVSNK